MHVVQEVAFVYARAHTIIIIIIGVVIELLTLDLGEVGLPMMCRGVFTETLRFISHEVAYPLISNLF